MVKYRDLINHYFNRMRSIRRQEVIVGIGDDCALLSVAKNTMIAISTDTLVMGTHFVKDIDPAHLGYKSLAVNLSDLAAMGAEPAWLSLSLTLPSVDESWLAAYSNSLFEQLDNYDMQLIGGDMTMGPLSLTMTIHGLITEGHALTRTGASIGDLIYVTGTLGDSAAGLAILQNSLQVKHEEDRQYLLTRHLRPEPRIRQGQVLRNLASAAIDLSDGLMTNLRDILASSSSCNATINLDAIPCSPGLLRQTSQDQAIHWALSGGEDYELCFTVPEIKRHALEVAMKDTGVLVTCIGQIISATNSHSADIQFLRHNQPVQVPNNDFRLW